MASGLPGSYSAPQEDQPINQSILVSGESGAGKTETTKFIMQYLATVAGTGSAGQGIEKKVLQSNPVLEAFGNARTIRNDNSSRFGKFIEIHFHARQGVTPSNSTCSKNSRKSSTINNVASESKMEKFKGNELAGPMLVGAAIQTYLLEKVRLVTQQEGERNYHVFYELIAGASPSLRERLQLPQCLDQDATVKGGWMDEYRYVNQSGCFERHDHVDDAEQFRHTAIAMKEIGLNKQSLATQKEEPLNETIDEESVGFGEVLKVVAAVLHLGNLTFESYENKEASKKAEGSTAVDGPPPVKTRAAVGRAAALLAKYGSGDKVQEDDQDVDDQCAASFALDMTASLLGVNQEGLSKALCSRKIEVNGEEFTMVEDPRAASHARDGAAKVIYNHLFLWLVQQINHSLTDIDAEEKTSSGRTSGGRPSMVGTTPPRAKTGGRGGRPTGGFIGVLDIFGFESFRTNSFEQLCINFANEKLQQQFNGFIFELEQQVYEQEEILWSMVDFPDNSACLELIERKHTGILALLDEQCVLMSRSSDKGFASQLYEFHAKVNKHPNFRAGAAEMRGSLFIVHHYAGEVCYDTEGFLEKNVDKINPLVLDLLLTSSSELVNTIAKAAGVGNTPSTPSPTASASGAPLAGGSGRRGSKATSRALSVGSQFKGQLNDLLIKINATRPHFVRCIKPNDRNEATLWHGRRVLSQLRCGGVLEAVRVSRAGYPNRLSHAAFISRYQLIKPILKGNDKSSRSACLVLLRSLLPDMFLRMNENNEQVDVDYEVIDRCVDNASNSLSEKCKVLLSKAGLQLGRSKVFMRMVSFASLEQLRMKALRSAVLVIQKEVRRRLCMWQFREVMNSVLLITKTFRGYLGRNKVTEMRRNRAATRMACFRRRLLARRCLVRAKNATSIVSGAWRCFKARRVLIGLKQQACSKQLCCWWRQAIATKRYAQLKLVTLYCQCKWRRVVAKRRAKALRLQAKNLDSVAAERDALKLRLQEMEKMMASTQQGANAMIQENATLKQTVHEVNQAKQKAEELVVAARASVTSSDSQEPLPPIEQSVIQTKENTSKLDESENSGLSREMESLLNEQLLLQAAKADAAERRVEELERALSASMQRSDTADSSRIVSPRPTAALNEEDENNQINQSSIVVRAAKNSSLSEPSDEAFEETEDMSHVFLDPEGEWCAGASTPLHVACTVGDVELVAEFLVVAAKSLLHQPEEGVDETSSPLFHSMVGALPPLPPSPEKAGHGYSLDEDYHMDEDVRFARLSSFSFSPFTFEGIPDQYEDVIGPEDKTPLLMWTSCLGHILTLHDADGRVALHAASQGGHDLIVKALVEAAASTTVQEVIALSERLVSDTFEERDSEESESDLAIEPTEPEGHEFPWEVVVAAAKTMAKTPTQREYAYLCSHRGLLGSAALCDVSDVRGDTSLHLCRSANTALKLLESGANPNLVNKDGQTPLHIAIRARNVNLVSRLLIGGADPHIAETGPSAGWSALLLACSMPEALGLVKPFFTCTRVFLDLSKTDKEKNTAMHICCRYGGSLSLSQEEAAKRGVADMGSSSMRKAWRGGGQSSQKDAKKSFVGSRGKSSGRPDQVDDKKRFSESVGRGVGSRFRAASMSGESKGSPIKRDSGDIEDRELGVLRTIQLLLSHGADPNAKNAHEMTPIHDLVNNIFLRELSGDKAKLGESEEKGVSSERDLQRRTRRGVSDAPAYQPTSGVNGSPNKQDSIPSTSGSLVLHACAVTLLGSHCDASSLDCFESSPLLDAARVGDLGLCELLVRHGANLNHLQPRGKFDKMLQWRKEVNTQLRSSLKLKKSIKSDLTTPIWQRVGNGQLTVVESPSVNTGLLPDPFLWLTSDSSKESTSLSVNTEGGDELSPFVTFYELCPTQSFMKSVLRAVCSPPTMVPDAALKHCMNCRDAFSETRWRHHCRLCARLLCHGCSSRQCPASAFPSGFDSSLHPNDTSMLTVSRASSRNERVCDACYAVLSLRVVKQQASKPTIVPSEASAVSPSKSPKPPAAMAPNRRMRRGSAPDGSSVFQSLLSPNATGSSDSVKLSPGVPPPRPPDEKVKKSRTPFFKRSPSKQEANNSQSNEVSVEDDEEIVRNFSMLDDVAHTDATTGTPNDKSVESSSSSPMVDLAFPSLDHLTSTIADTQSSGSLFSRLSESLTRITSRSESSGSAASESPTPKGGKPTPKRNLRNLMKPKKKESSAKSEAGAGELDQEHRRGDGTSGSLE